MASMLYQRDIDTIVEGRHGSPFDVLGLHVTGPDRPSVIIRTFQPFAAAAAVLETDTDTTHALERIHQDGLFELVLPNREPFRYRLRMQGADDHAWESEDPYRFALQITDNDQDLFGKGTHCRTYENTGAHPMTVDGVPGVHFTVWAPNAARVSVVGDFNQWDVRHHPLHGHNSSGLWELFVPGLVPGDLYKFAIKSDDGHEAFKADPYAFACELPPRSASRVWDVRGYAWNDAEWLERRRRTNWHEQPVSVYEVHLGSWRRVPEEGHRWLTYRELADQLVPYVRDLGFTHIELLPVSEHPFDGSWGYQTTGYYAPTARFGKPDDFAALVDCCHAAGIGVILDWVPSHFPRDAHGLAQFDGTHLYEHADPRKGEHSEWGTLALNHGRLEVHSFLLSNALYWAEVFHIDGLRVDAVASMLYLDYAREDGKWIPNPFGGPENLEAVEFLKSFNEIVHAEHPGFLTFAEDSTAWPMVSRPTDAKGLGFDFKWNMCWMHKTLDYFKKDPIYRRYHHDESTYSLLFAFHENFILPFSHDEVVHGKGSMLSKMPGEEWQKFANLRLLYALMFAHPGKKLFFMGSEIGQWSEWSHLHSLDWHVLEQAPHRRLRTLVRELNRLYRNLPALHQLDCRWEGFDWIDFQDAKQSVVSFLRRGDDRADYLVCVFNFTPVTRHEYRIGVPDVEPLETVLNTDADVFGGSGEANPSTVQPETVRWQGQPCSVTLTLPPLAALYLRPTTSSKTDRP